MKVISGRKGQLHSLCNLVQGQRRERISLYPLKSREGDPARQALPGRTSHYPPRSREETRRQEVVTTSWGNRSRPYKVHREMDSKTTGFVSEAKRSFVIQQFDRRPSQKNPPALKFSVVTQQKVQEEKNARLYCFFLFF
ncbi:hypothetical protein TNIN_15971 [Trichonephila inaurata madagascariensis]|uniref:Uncharacterized protein n=1 Tax=Trichonephila inaurata madagascariensis TaxID=2747483 RepID=A0A8X6Y788_9ARAC|nr:hypothetical protein TNIN_15971 [Trichonephila inaurata madagascariensis]